MAVALLGNGQIIDAQNFRNYRTDVSNLLRPNQAQLIDIENFIVRIKTISSERLDQLETHLRGETDRRIYITQNLSDTAKDLEKPHYIFYARSIFEGVTGLGIGGYFIVIALNALRTLVIAASLIGAVAILTIFGAASYSSFQKASPKERKLKIAAECKEKQIAIQQLRNKVIIAIEQARTLSITRANDQLRRNLYEVFKTNVKLKAENADLLNRVVNLRQRNQLFNVNLNRANQNIQNSTNRLNQSNANADNLRGSLNRADTVIEGLRDDVNRASETMENR